MFVLAVDSRWWEGISSNEENDTVTTPERQTIKVPQKPYSCVTRTPVESVALKNKAVRRGYRPTVYRPSPVQ